MVFVLVLFIYFLNEEGKFIGWKVIFDSGCVIGVLGVLKMLEFVY